MNNDNITRQDYFATKAMQGLLADGASRKMTKGEIAETAADIAEAVISELDDRAPKPWDGVAI